MKRTYVHPVKLLAEDARLIVHLTLNVYGVFSAALCDYSLNDFWPLLKAGPAVTEDDALDLLHNALIQKAKDYQLDIFSTLLNLKKEYNNATNQKEY